MMKIEHFTCNMLQENCYVVSDETKQCVIIDCGAYYEAELSAIIDYIKTAELTPVHLLVTHGHFDHNFGNAAISQAFGLSPEISRHDKQLLDHCDEQAKTFGVDFEQPCIPAGRLLENGEKITFGNHVLQVIETPGHSQGSVVFYCEDEKTAFTGDTLFRGSIGRTDFVGGSMLQIIQSLRMLAQLPDDTVVMPGHGSQTTIGYELAHNPYMDR